MQKVLVCVLLCCLFWHLAPEVTQVLDFRVRGQSDDVTGDSPVCGNRSTEGSPSGQWSKRERERERERERGIEGGK